MEKENTQIVDEEIELFDLILPLVKNKNLIIRALVYTFFISAIISLLLPKIYKSTAKILPPQTQSSISSQILSQMSGPAGLVAPGGLKDNSLLYAEFLKTNSVLDYVAEKNNLSEIYKIKDRDKLRKKLLSNILVEQDKKTGILTLSYLDKSPEIAYKSVISFIEGLKRLNNEIAVTEASQRRLFYEEQLNRAKEELIKSEEELKKFQQRTGSIKIDEEAKAAVEEYSLLRAKISSKEVQLKVLKTYATAENPEYKMLIDEIAALKDQLFKLQSKIPSEDESLFSTKKVSIYGIEFIRKMREFKYNEALYEILLKQYEAAKIDESKDATIIQIIEKPEIPIKKFKPQRIKIVLKWLAIVFFLIVMWIYVKEFYYNSLKDPLTKDKIDIVKEYLNFFDLKDEILKDWYKIKKIVYGITSKK